MFKSSIIIPAWILIACSLPACSSSNGGNGGQGGAGGEGGDSSSYSDDNGGTAGSDAGDACIKYGPITKDTTWAPLAACPDGFDVPEYVTVSGAGTSLTIDPGVSLKFASGAGIEVQASASLVAVGTAAKPITFTGWQEEPGAWSGITLRSSAVANEIAYAVVEYAGETDGASAAIVLGYDEQYARLKLSNTEIRNNALFGMTVYERTTLAAFENNTITENAAGAIRVEAPSVHQLNGAGNAIADNGNGNIVRIEADASMPLDSADVTWPNLSPAIYRVTGAGGDEGGVVLVKRHLTIEAGSVFEFVGGSGLNVTGGTAGLSAVGTATKPIVLRGVDDSGWSGIGLWETSWTGNALENVEIANAAGPPQYSLIYVGDWVASVAVGQITADDAARLRIKNVSFIGPNSSVNDVVYLRPAVLTVEGTNTGSGTSGAAKIITLS